MQYIAKKLCKFAGREFRINEIIPDGYVHNTAAPRLINMGVIAEDSAGSLLPASSSIENNEAAAIIPEPAEEIPEPEQELAEDKKEITKDDLMKLKRDELVLLAEEAGIEVKDADTKADIAAALLGEGSDE